MYRCSEHGARADLKNLEGTPAFAGLLSAPSANEEKRPDASSSTSASADWNPAAASSAAAGHRFQQAQQLWSSLKDTEGDEVHANEASVSCAKLCLKILSISLAASRIIGSGTIFRTTVCCARMSLHSPVAAIVRCLVICSEGCDSLFFAFLLS